MIRFFTSSLNISTDVPCASEPFAAEDPEEVADGSDVPDCTSQSRGSGMLGAVGVETGANCEPVAEETLPSWLEA